MTTTPSRTVGVRSEWFPGEEGLARKPLACPRSLWAYRKAESTRAQSAAFAARFGAFRGFSSSAFANGSQEWSVLTNLWNRQLRECSKNATATSEPKDNNEDNKECSGHNRAGTRSYDQGMAEAGETRSRPKQDFT